MDATVGRHRVMLIAVGVLALAVMAGAALLWPRGEANRPAVTGQEDPTRLVSATLTRVQPVLCKEADPGVPSSTCVNVEARLTDGKQVRFETTDLTGDTFQAGQQVRLSVLEQEGQPTLPSVDGGPAGWYREATIRGAGPWTCSSATPAPRAGH
jgi:hypothetical protein